MSKIALREDPWREQQATDSAPSLPGDTNPVANQLAKVKYLAVQDTRYLVVNNLLLPKRSGRKMATFAGHGGHSLGPYGSITLTERHGATGCTPNDQEMLAAAVIAALAGGPTVGVDGSTTASPTRRLVRRRTLSATSFRRTAGHCSGRSCNFVSTTSPELRRTPWASPPVL